MLAERAKDAEGEWVFPGDRQGAPILGTSLAHQHKNVRDTLKLSGDFVIHSLRHTMLTRLGEAGVDAFTIHEDRGAQQRHRLSAVRAPDAEAMERAFERLEAFNSGSGKQGGHTEGTPIQEQEKDAA